MVDFAKLSTLPLFDNSLMNWSIALGVAAHHLEQRSLRQSRP